MFDTNKTCPELCHALGVSKKSAYDDMMFVKYLFCQTEGRQYLHWILSHDVDVSLSAVNSVAEKVIHLLGDRYQVIAATHTNTRNLHTHFLINPVDIKTGKKFSESTAEMLKFREKINVILRGFGLHECGAIETITEAKIDEDDEGSQSLQLYQFYRGKTFEGSGSVVNGDILLPGVLHESNIETSDTTDLCMYEEGRSFQVIQHYRDQMFVGKGFIEDENILIPGILHEVDQKQEAGTEFVQYIDGHLYRGKVGWDNGNFLIPGVLYEEDNDEKDQYI